jgi:flagellar hook assembly protein FlgD
MITAVSQSPPRIRTRILARSAGALGLLLATAAVAVAQTNPTAQGLPYKQDFASLTADSAATVNAGSPGSFVTTVTTAEVPVTLSRTNTTPVLGFSVRFTLSGLTTTAGAITEGGFLTAGGGTTSFHVIDNGGGSFTVDGVTLGTPCGSSATGGTLFTVNVGSSLLAGTGTLTLDAVTLRDCTNATLPSVLGTAASVGVDRSTPAIAVTSPNGGESWAQGSVHAITWTATDPEGIEANSVALEVSLDNGGSWQPVAGGLANSGTFNWTVPGTPSAGARVRASALDVHANPASDASDAAFTIQLASSTTVASSLDPSTFGASVTFTATVTPSGATGSVQFFDGVASLGTSPLVAGSAALSTSALAAGSHPITAVYSGDTDHAGSTSGLLAQVVNAAGTSVTLVASPSPGVFLDPETLTATVAPPSATGSIEFFAGAASLGTSPVAAGSAQLVTSSLSVGPHSLTAVYSGDVDHSGASSSAVALEIQARIVATAGANGSVTPSGTLLVSLGATPSFAFAADAGYHVASVAVDGSAAPLTSPYTLTPVSANHTLDVLFATNPAVAPITTLSSIQRRTGNDNDGTTKITLTWTPVPAGSTVEVWRKGYGNYPEYNGGASPGSTPATPTSYPPAGWTLTAVASPGDTDEPAARDFWYYIAYVRDSFGTVSPVSNGPSGALNYHLGDISDATTVGAGDNRVTTTDVSVLGLHYGLGGAAAAPYNYLDVGPTTDLSVTARPMADGRINFEDLVMFALNYYPVASLPQSRARPASASGDGVTLSAPTHVGVGEDVWVHVLFSGTGQMQALSTRLAWDPTVVEPVSWSAGDALLGQGGLAFSPEPGTVDGASFTGSGQGLVGEGEFAALRFRVVAAGDPRFGFAKVDARDHQNHTLAVSSGVLAVTPRAFVTAFAPAMPNPFRRTTAFQFSLARPGRADLELFSVGGRRVRTLSSGAREAGEYRLEWNGSDDSGRPLAAGVYYARLLTAQGRFTRVVTLFK